MCQLKYLTIILLCKKKKKNLTKRVIIGPFNEFTPNRRQLQENKNIEFLFYISILYNTIFHSMHSVSTAITCGISSSASNWLSVPGEMERHNKHRESKITSRRNEPEDWCWWMNWKLMHSFFAPSQKLLLLHGHPAWLVGHAWANPKILSSLHHTFSSSKLAECGQLVLEEEYKPIYKQRSYLVIDKCLAKAFFSGNRAQESRPYSCCRASLRSASSGVSMIFSTDIWSSNAGFNQTGSNHNKLGGYNHRTRLPRGRNSRLKSYCI